VLWSFWIWCPCSDILRLCSSARSTRGVTHSLSYRADGFDSFMDAFMKIQQVSLDRSIRGGLWPLFELFGDKSKKYGDIIKVLRFSPKRNSDAVSIMKRATRSSKSMGWSGSKLEMWSRALLVYLSKSPRSDVLSLAKNGRVVTRCYGVIKNMRGEGRFRVHRLPPSTFRHPG